MSGEKLATPDEHLPSELIKDAKERLGACSVCPAWMFTSKTEKDRHNSVLHSTKNHKPFLLSHVHRQVAPSSTSAIMMAATEF